MSARKKLKKMTLKEVKAPDEFQTTVARAIEFMQAYGTWVLSGVAVVLVVIVAGILLSRHGDTVTLETALAFDKAFAGVVEQTELEPTGPVGEDEDIEKMAKETSSKLKAASSLLDEFSTANKGTPIGGLALFAKGAAAMGSGDNETAYAAYRAYLDSTPDNTLAFIAWESLGIASDRLGKSKESEEAFREMAKSSSSMVSANAYLHLGDLFNPATGGGNGDAVKAGEFYETGLKEVAGEPDSMPPAMLLTRRTLEQRIAALP